MDQPTVQFVSGPLYPRVKRPRREADHSHLSVDEINNAWNCTSTFPYVFMECCLIKQWIYEISN